MAGVQLDAHGRTLLLDPVVDEPITRERSDSLVTSRATGSTRSS